MDGLWSAGVRNVEPVQYQLDMWEQFFGDIIHEWMIGRGLPKQDPYWAAYETDLSARTMLPPKKTSPKRERKF